MSTQQNKYEDLSEEQLAIAEELAETDEALGPVFAAMLEDVAQGGDQS
jgi:hypothetical protein